MIQRESLVDKNEVIVDEKRRIALNTRSLTHFQNQLYQRNYFKSYRPDLNSFDYYIWLEKWKLGECFLNEMSRVFNREVFRAAVHTPETENFKRTRHYLEERNNLGEPYILGNRLVVDRNWEEANKLVAYVDRVLRKIHKYGLEYPGFVNYYSKEQLESKEAELVERFYREMRKPPKE